MTFPYNRFPSPSFYLLQHIINMSNKKQKISPCEIRNGIKQRRTIWQDGVLGTNCPIPPGSNWTYKFQAKDQIGTYNYFPTTAMHRAAGGFGGFNIASRSVISIPYPIPVAEFTLLISDWYKAGHQVCYWKASDIFLNNPFNPLWFPTMFIMVN